MPDAPTSADQRVLGIDLSLTSTGLSTGLWCNTIETKGHDDDPWDIRHARLATITTPIIEVARNVHLAAIEAPAYSRNTGKAFDRAGIWWTVYNRLHRLNIPIAVITPGTRCRYATGNGGAKKDRVLAAAIKRYGHLVDIDGHDQADALILAAMALDHLGQPLPVDLPDTHRAALTAVHWPTTEETP